MTKTENVIGGSLGCLAILAILGSIAGATTTFVYMVIALKEEYTVDMTAYHHCGSVKKWCIFIAIWTGLTVYAVFLKSKDGDKKQDVGQYAAEAVLHFLLAAGFGFGTMDHYWNVCKSPEAVKIGRAHV